MSEVGINPFNMGWDQLYKKLYVPGWKGMALDVSAFDASFPWVMARKIATLRLRRLSPEARQLPMAEKLVAYITESIFRSLNILPNGEVVQKEHGNASGSPNTVVDNTLALAMAFMYVWVRSCRLDGTPPSFMEFKENVRAALYGDDNTFTASELAQVRLSYERMQQFFGELGWKVTMESEGWVPTDQLTFLQRGFSEYNGIKVPKCVDGVKALDSLLHKSHGDVTLTYQRAASLLVIYWWNVEERVVIQGFLDRLESEYFYSGSMRDLSVRSTRLTPAQIVRLYIDPNWCLPDQ
jgi:hypothetical protein